MHKRGFMLAIGIPLAREDPGEHDDEYKLGPREHDSSDEQQRPHDALTSIYEGIRDGGGDEQMMRDGCANAGPMFDAHGQSARPRRISGLLREMLPIS